MPAPGEETEKAADLIGQGKVLASPMAMATVAASVQRGQDGHPAPAADHEVPAAGEPDAADRRRRPRSCADLMRAVVTEGVGRLPGRPARATVGAKTGTAEYGEPGADGRCHTHTWMVATQDDLAVAVFVETGESGSRTAGPLLEAFLS